jgi:anti-sigma B factor antagonist
MSQMRAHPLFDDAGVPRTGDTHLGTFPGGQQIRNVKPMETAESSTHRIAARAAAGRQQVTSAREGDETQLRIEGALDACTIHEIAPILDAAVADHPRRVTVDLDDLTILDSMGVGAMVSLWKRVKAQGGKVVVVRAHAQPLLVLKLLRLDAVFGM